MPIFSFKAYFRLLSPYPYISTLAPFQAEFAPLQALLQGIWNYFRLNLSAISLRCSSESCFVGFIFILATGIWAHKLPSWFSATISHSSGRSAASFLMRLLYRPWQKVTAALSLSVPLRPRMQSPLLQCTGKTSDKAPSCYIPFLLSGSFPPWLPQSFYRSISYCAYPFLAHSAVTITVLFFVYCFVRFTPPNSNIF